jgi:hypothetical protein
MTDVKAAADVALDEFEFEFAYAISDIDAKLSDALRVLEDALATARNAAIDVYPHRRLRDAAAELEKKIGWAWDEVESAFCSVGELERTIEAGD